MLRKIYITIAILIAAILTAKGQTVNNNNDTDGAKDILIICSYNPDIPSVTNNISDFHQTCQRRRSDYNLTIESLYCRNVPDMPEWESRMQKILKRHFGKDNKPDVIVLLGTESASVYFSLDKSLFDGRLTQVPLFIGMRGYNVVLMPEEGTILSNWYPETLDLREDFDDYNIIGAKLLDYDVEENINLIRKIFPNTKEVMFISDNTFGGITMQALVRKEAAKTKKLKVSYCDGRQLSLQEVKRKITKIKDPDTAILVGTWRVDRTNNYVIGSSKTALANANPDVPVFTLSSAGISSSHNHECWAIGGYIPGYSVTGAELANDCLNYLENDSIAGLTLLPNEYLFDYHRLKQFNIPESILPPNAVFTNKPASFIEEHPTLVYIISGILITLLILYIITNFYLYRVRKLNANLTILNEELTVAKERAEEANRSKTSFLANMSHEIRTPLNAIVGFSSIIASSGADLPEKDRQEMGEIINTNTSILLKLINDILDLSRIESGKIFFELHNVDIISLCKTVFVTARQNRKNNNTEYQLDLKVSQLVMATDGERLQQVLINLLSNAAKCTPSGIICLGLDVDKKRQLAIFSVTDTGCGVPKDKAEKIFERFEKLDIFKQGTGLGLAICRTIVEKFGGNIWVDTDYTEGARFVFTHSLCLSCGTSSKAHL